MRGDIGSDALARCCVLPIDGERPRAPQHLRTDLLFWCLGQFGVAQTIGAGAQRGEYVVFQQGLLGPLHKKFRELHRPARIECGFHIGEQKWYGIEFATGRCIEQFGVGNVELHGTKVMHACKFARFFPELQRALAKAFALLGEIKTQIAAPAIHQRTAAPQRIEIGVVLPCLDQYQDRLEAVGRIFDFNEIEQ